MEDNMQANGQFSENPETTSDTSISSVVADEKTIEKVCPFCKTEIKDGDEVIVCPACGIQHHKGCWGGNKGCTTFGCKEQHYEAQGTNSTAVCQNCGATLGDGQMFCSKCGTPIDEGNGNICVESGNIAEPRKLGKKRKLKNIVSLIISSLLVLAVCFFLFCTPIINYNRAKRFYEKKEYEQAVSILIELENYESAQILMHQIQYDMIYKSGFNSKITSALNCANLYFDGITQKLERIARHGGSFEFDYNDSNCIAMRNYIDDAYQLYKEYKNVMPDVIFENDYESKRVDVAFKELAEYVNDNLNQSSLIVFVIEVTNGNVSSTFSFEVMTKKVANLESALNALPLK